MKLCGDRHPRTRHACRVLFHPMRDLKKYTQLDRYEGRDSFLCDDDSDSSRSSTSPKATCIQATRIG